MQREIRKNFENFNPRSSCEERLGMGAFRRTNFDFNPRSSCEERQLQR